MRVALVAEGFFVAGAFGLPAEGLEAAFDLVLARDAAGLFVEVAIKLRYHPASSVACWASNGYMKIVRWMLVTDFRSSRSVLPERGLWLR